MDKRIKKSSYLILALVLCLFSVTAFAATSSASISMGTVSSTGAAQDLTNGNTVRGYVRSDSQTEGGNLTGKMYTKGSVFTHCRGTVAVFSGTTYFSSYTCNTDGTFWSTSSAPDGNHSGKTSVYN